MDIHLFAGIDLGATNIKYGLVDDQGRPVYKNKLPTPNNGDAEKLFAAIARCGEMLLIEADNREAMVEDLGVGTPGTVDIKRGMVIGACPNIPGWVDFPLRDKLRDRLNIPIYIENDANCAALAEFEFGSGQGVQSILCLTIGTGIGGGMIIDGRLYRGSGSAAGEIGQIPVRHRGKTVALESLVSSRAILAEVRKRLEDNIPPLYESLIGTDPERLTIRKLFTAIRRNDTIGPEVLEETGEMLGRALAGLVDVVNPEMVILGGGVVEGGSLFVDIVNRSLRENALEIATESLRVVPARLGNAAGFIGAAMLGRHARMQAEK